MKLSDFDYNLPQELIAQYPLKERDSARLMVINREKGIIEHRFFKDITEYMSKEDLLVLNDTKVMPARLFGSRLSGGKVEILLLKNKTELLPQGENSLTEYIFEALIRPNRVKLEEPIIFENPTLPCGELQGYYRRKPVEE